MEVGRGFVCAAPSSSRSFSFPLISPVPRCLALLSAPAYTQYHTDGYVIIDGLIPDELYEPLCTAADEVTAKGRAHEWKDVRMVGKQFPPWVEGDDVWGVQNIMHPDLHQPVFAKWYGSEDLLDVSAALMGVTRDDMQFGESSLLTLTPSLLLLSPPTAFCCRAPPRSVCSRRSHHRTLQHPRQPPREGLRALVAPRRHQGDRNSRGGGRGA